MEQLLAQTMTHAFGAKSWSLVRSIGNRDCETKPLSATAELVAHMPAAASPTPVRMPARQDMGSRLGYTV